MPGSPIVHILKKQNKTEKKKPDCFVLFCSYFLLTRTKCCHMLRKCPTFASWVFFYLVLSGRVTEPSAKLPYNLHFMNNHVIEQLQ